VGSLGSLAKLKVFDCPRTARLDDRKASAISNLVTSQMPRKRTRVPKAVILKGGQSGLIIRNQGIIVEAEAAAGLEEDGYV
jgi:hypothetical protein